MHKTRRPRQGWPDEAAALQPLAEQAHAAAVVPQNLDQRGEIVRPFDQNPGCLIVMMNPIFSGRRPHNFSHAYLDGFAFESRD